MTRDNGIGIGIENFRRLANGVLGKIVQLRECKQAVQKAIVDLSSNSETLIQILRALELNVGNSEWKRSFWNTAGVGATTMGSTVAAGLWLMSALAPPVAICATAVGIGGTVIKTATSYLSSRTNKGYLAEVEACLSSDHSKEMEEAEKDLKLNIGRMVRILKELYGESRQQPAGEVKEEISRETGEAEGEEGSPVIITVMETVDMAGCAPDVISTVLDYSSDLGIEATKGLEQTYEAATASLGEVISFGILEGAANGLAVVLSTYEVYRLIGSWNQEHPTTQKIKDLICQVERKVQAYRSTKNAIEAIDRLMKLRIRASNVK